jgi:hypothetical protein
MSQLVEELRWLRRGDLGRDGFHDYLSLYVYTVSSQTKDRGGLRTIKPMCLPARGHAYRRIVTYKSFAAAGLALEGDVFHDFLSPKKKNC